ncbi:MAG: response regulator, partial [Thermoanaerobaculia bacterium]
MGRILVVDDEPIVVEGIRAILELHDLESESASDVESARERIEEEFFPVILADLRMRGEADGLQLIEAVREISPRSRVAAMTGYATAEMERLLRERGAQLVLRKPLGEDELMSALREMLAAVEAAEAECGDDETLYAATIKTLYGISRGRF